MAGRARIYGCGTDAGYEYHRANGETTCAECRRAHAEAKSRQERGFLTRPRRVTVRRREPGRPRTKGCGTEAGEKWHRRHGERVCLECADAVNEANARRRAARRSGEGLSA